MTDAAAPRPGFVIKGRHVLIAFLVFFGIDIAVNSAFMVWAYRTFPGETVASPYEDGVAFNAALRARARQSRLGWRFVVGSEGADDLRLDAFDRAGAPLRGLTVGARLRRPATDAGARSVALVETAPGVYRAGGQIVRGAWDLELTARDARGETATAQRRLIGP